MKQFFKFLFASCLGTLIAMAFLFFFLVLFAISSQPVKRISSNSILKLEFSNATPEKTDNVPEDGFILSPDPFIGQHRVKELINHAKTDDKIEGIVLRTEFPNLARATSSGIYKAIQDFKESGKFVFAYGDFYSQNGYFLSTAADSIYMNPNGSVDIRGFSIATYHLKNVMEKIGLKMNVFYKGKYKGATETYLREGMSEENKQQYREYLEDVKSDVFGKIASARNFTTDHLNKIADNFESTNSEAALDLNLVDALYYQREFENMLRTKLDISEKSKIKYVSLPEYHESVKIKSSSTSKDRIAIIYAEGNILYNNDNNGVISYKRYKKVFERIAKNKNVKGVVLRVNSPGGVAFVADNIWHELQTLKEKGKYITVSMGDYAASGGYYIACMADTILAEENTLTGSIGVYLMLPEASELLNEKIGINFDTVKTNNHAFSLSPVFPLSSKDKDVLKQLADSEYSKFLSRVAEGRGMTKEQVDEVAQGRIWSGVDAIEAGLVDKIGDLEDAIEITATQVDIDDYKIIEYPVIEKDIYREFMKAFSQNMMIRQFLPGNGNLKYKKLINYIESLNDYSGLQARLPEIFLD